MKNTIYKTSIVIHFIMSIIVLMSVAGFSFWYAFAVEVLIKIIGLFGTMVAGILVDLSKGNLKIESDYESSSNSEIRLANYILSLSFMFLLCYFLVGNSLEIALKIFVLRFAMIGSFANIKSILWSEYSQENIDRITEGMNRNKKSFEQWQSFFIKRMGKTENNKDKEKNDDETES